MSKLQRPTEGAGGGNWPGRTLPGALPLLVQLAAVFAWLWPIGLGGAMPVGGDVTQFSMGLMAVLGRSLRALRLPVWNELWGYGFPGVAESQMGVYYPPHWLFYGALPVEAGYVASLVFHTAFGSLGAYWAARRFGVSPWGASLAGFAWTACGFSVIHLPHQWGYTTGGWMPWAWGLAWSSLRDPGARGSAFLLTLVLAVQTLPGHFQLAFATQVGVLLLALATLAERPRSPRAVGRTLAAWLAAFPLAALQLWPTLRLAQRAATQRDFEYLSGFAASPLHLVTFWAPGLFERSPLWRPLVWDPFHTSPEEYFGYVGLVPLFLSLGAVRSGLRRSPEVRALTLVTLVTLWFALGPYVPGFSLLTQLPGFSFFRAPGRWVLATSLGLSLLAGLGFDALRAWPRPGRSLARFALAGFALPLLVVGIVEVGLAATDRPGLPAVARVYAAALDRLPWRTGAVFEGIVRDARRPNDDLRVAQAWARQGIDLARAPRPVFSNLRLGIYREELAPSFALCAALALVALLSGRPRTFRVALVALTYADLLVVGRHHRVDTAPLAPLTTASPVMRLLAERGAGARSLDSLGNLPMVAGTAPVLAYRTLDLPTVPALTNLALRIPANEPEWELTRRAIDATGASFRVFDPFEVLEVERRGKHWPGWHESALIRDPNLAGWKFGTDWVAQQGPWASTFRVWQTPGEPTRAWFLPATGAGSAETLPELLAGLSRSPSATVRRLGPTEREVDLAGVANPAQLIVSELEDPQWVASNGGQRLTTGRVFASPGGGAWLGVSLPPGVSGRVRLRYEARDVGEGLAISAVAALLWVGAFRIGGRGRPA